MSQIALPENSLYKFLTYEILKCLWKCKNLTIFKTRDSCSSRQLFKQVFSCSQMCQTSFLESAINYSTSFCVLSTCAGKIFAINQMRAQPRALSCRYVYTHILNKRSTEPLFLSLLLDTVDFTGFHTIVAPKNIMLTMFSRIRLRDDKVSIYILSIYKRKTESSVGLARECKASLGLSRKNAKHRPIVNGVTCEHVSPAYKRG